MRQLRDPALAAERFLFNWTEFSTQIAYLSVELDNGTIVTAEASQFNDVVERTRISGGRIRLSVEGKVLNERLKKAS